MFKIETLLVLVPTLPLLATLVTAALGPRVLRHRSHWPALVAIGLSCLASLILVVQVQLAADRDRRDIEQAKRAIDQGRLTGEEAEAAAEKAKQVGSFRLAELWTWAAVDRAYTPTPPADRPGETKTYDFRVDVTLRADPLTAFMLATVTLISLLVAVYSIGSIRGDPAAWRFFTYLALFVFSMTMLVSVSNFVLLYVFWEAVGLCSYLVIGFRYQQPEAAAAGKKAFLVNRVGDLGFALGVFLIWTAYGTLNFHDTPGVPGVLGQLRLAGTVPFVAGGVATAICLLLLLGACGKSSQLPLPVWLPDAVEAPAPGGALIQAATTVTAGVYLVARCAPLFSQSEYAVRIVAVLGGATALLAAAIAVTQTDLRRILAYSTVSQLGTMFLGLGTLGAGAVAGVTAAIFHLFTHAFFKALLVLGAGSVIRVMGGVADIRRLGGLRRRMPVTYWTFLAGSLAMAGLVPFAGFFSRNAILLAVHGQAGGPYRVLFWAAVGTAFLTALYAFRALLVTFHGEERIPHEAGDRAHESPGSMTGPLVVLAVGSLAVGWMAGGIARFLIHTPSLGYLVQRAPETHAEAGSHLLVAILGLAVVAFGIGLAWFLYSGERTQLERLARRMDELGLNRLAHGKLFLDQIYDILVVWPLEGIAWLCSWADRYVVDGLVNLCGLAPKALGAALRPMQSGMIQFYALAMVLGLLALIAALVM